MTEEQGLREWLQENPPVRLSAVQAGRHMILQVFKAKTELGEYFRRCLDERSTPTAGERMRNLLPLPLWPAER